MTPPNEETLRALIAKWRKNGNATRNISRSEDVELRASNAQMREIHANWNRIAFTFKDDSSLWPTVEAIAEILFREFPSRSQYGQPNPAGCSMLTCADELEAALAKQSGRK